MKPSVRRPRKGKRLLTKYSGKHRITKSEAVKRVLKQLFEQPVPQVSAYESSKRFRGSDKSPGDVARHTKRLLGELRTEAPRDAARQSTRLLRELRTKSSLTS